MRAKMIPIILLFLLAGTAFSDSATMWVFPDGSGAMPIETDEITMLAESVSIVPTGNTLTHTDVPEMQVTCVFYLENLTDTQLDVSVGFPFESFYGMQNYGSRNEWSYDYVTDDMSTPEAKAVPVDSMVPDWLHFEAYTSDEEYEVSYQRGVVNRANRLVFWPLIACWEMHFQPGERVRLVNRYITGWNYSSYTDYTASLTYTVRSGELWAGRIGDAVISITVPDMYPISILSDSACSWADWNSSPEVEGNTVTWHFTDWKPVEDLTVTLSGHLYLDNRGYDWALYRDGDISFHETELYSDWIAGEPYPAALRLLSEIAGGIPGETVIHFLENSVYGLSGLSGPYEYLSDALFVYDELPFDSGMLDTALGLREQMARCRVMVESAEMDFLLPMAAIRRDWSKPNFEMYASNPKDQAYYLLLLENMEDAVTGGSITDPVMESLFRLTGWYLPGEVSPMIRQFRYWTSAAGIERDSVIVSRREVRDFWAGGAGCGLPLVLPLDESGCQHRTAGISVTVSSELSGNADRFYGASNLLDGNPETAWVEGAWGYGHGEVITVSTFGKCVAEGFAVRNGYCRPGGVWWENSRVRKLFVSLNGVPFMVAELEDTMGLQIIRFPEDLAIDSEDEITFEIIEVYPGAAYQDAAISELELIVQE
jgi:hypothetical protein